MHISLEVIATRLEVAALKDNEQKEYDNQPQKNGNSTLVPQLGLFSGVK